MTAADTVRAAIADHSDGRSERTRSRESQSGAVAAPLRPATVARDEQIIGLYEAGATLEQIGQPLGFTRERAPQLIDERKIVKRAS